MGRVPPVQHQRVPVGVVEEGHVADARVEDVAREPHALRLELGACRRDIAHAERDVVRIRGEGQPDLGRIPHAQRHLTGGALEPDARLVLEREFQSLEVETPRPGQILGAVGEEVDLLDLHYPTEPSICSWISRFISTAYSSGSSLVIGSTNPDTISAEASVSESPRDIR